VVIGEAVFDMLVRTGWLQDREVTNRRQVSRALSEMLADAAKQEFP